MEAETGVKKRKPRSGGATRLAGRGRAADAPRGPRRPGPRPRAAAGCAPDALAPARGVSPRGPSEPAWVAVGPSRVCPAA